MKNENSPFFCPKSPFDHAEMMRTLFPLTERYPAAELSYLGSTVLDRTIPMIKIGSGRREVLYVGAHHGMEWITAAILTAFLKELCERADRTGRVEGLDWQEFCAIHTLYVIPMLNPDGVEYQIHGIDQNHPLSERVLAMNGGSEDFSHWQANARGVDLNHNYDAGFADYKKLESEAGIFGGAPTRYSGEAPESEPEVRLLCDFIRYHSNLRGVITLHTQGEEIFYRSGGKVPTGSGIIARRLSELCGYRLSEAEGAASYGGLTDWCVRACSLPSFTLECGRGKNPLPITDFFPIYTGIRKALFRFPFLV
ncbi:MAG: peptidase M14 [Clostridia bacterium]|nr:peptidase M14 [Clostridia bacterium]